MSPRNPLKDLSNAKRDGKQITNSRKTKIHRKLICTNCSVSFYLSNTAISNKCNMCAQEDREKYSAEEIYADILEDYSSFSSKIEE